LNHHVSEFPIFKQVLMTAAKNSWVGLHIEHALSCVDTVPLYFNVLDADAPRLLAKKQQSGCMGNVMDALGLRCLRFGEEQLVSVDAQLTTTTTISGTGPEASAN
jgi:hypothetical protein